MTIAPAAAIHDIGIARQIGTYSDAIEVPTNARWLFTSGTPGLTQDGTLPTDISTQAELAWQHIDHMLRKAGMTINDIVKLTQYLVNAADIPAYAAVRARMLAGARPASMLLVVEALVRPGFLLEVEVIAAKGQ
jgi:2-iminobutanoate/2-iminopropanoate deaminase